MRIIFKSLLGTIGLWLTLLSSALVAAERSVSELTSALKSADQQARLQAIDELAAHGASASAAITPLADALRDKSPEVRSHAARALGQIGAASKAVVPALVELLKDEGAVVRRQAIAAVIAIRPGPQVTVPLCVKLLEESDPAIKVRILSAITDVGAAAVPGLVEALKNEKAAFWACVVLRDIGPSAKDAVPALISKLKDSSPGLRREVILTLAAMEGAAAPAIPQITAALDDEHAAVAATYALTRIGRLTTQAEAKIRSNAKSDDKMLSTVSTWALAHSHPEDKALHARSVEQLIERLKDDDPFVRVAAARGLAALPPAPEITGPIWEKALKNADEKTLNYTVDALARQGATIVPRLIVALGNEKFRPYALQVLRQIGPAAAPATKALTGLINDKNEEDARSAMLVLAAIGPTAKEAVPALSAALKQKDRADRPAVIFALGSIGRGAIEAKPALMELLSSSEQDLTQLSAWALSRIDPSAATAAKTVPVLISGLNSPLVVVRRGAADALGGFGPAARSAVQPLERAAKDSDQNVRDAAAKALASIRR
jgi:HEAT repeat protein